MTYRTESNNTVGIYVPSYSRHKNILTCKIFPFCNYVVRKSEYLVYRKACPDNVNIISVDDNLIDSIGKSREFIVRNSKEDVAIIIDDDVNGFYYTFKEHATKIDCKNTIVDEILRISQILIDLNLGFASSDAVVNSVKVSREFKFKGLTGTLLFINKKYFKSKFHPSLIKVDTDVVLQELLHNRIIIIPSYFACKGTRDHNKGGNNTAKNFQKLKIANDYLKSKWGKYYDFNYKSNKTIVRVER
jgi:hypothetical protein